jgi:hypothetical protein
MAVRRLNGWEQVGLQEMERDALAMAARGYRVVSADEYSLPALGIHWFKAVYELDVRGDPA